METNNWTGEADQAAETAGGGGGDKFPPAPRAVYTIQVADSKPGIVAKNGRKKIDLMCEIADQGSEFGKRVYITLTQIPKGENGHGIMVHTMNAFGLKFDGAYNFNPETAFQGKKARALLGVEPRTKIVNAGTPQERTFTNQVNFVEALYTTKHPEPANDELPPPPAPRAKAGTAAATKPEPQREAVQEEVPF